MINRREYLATIGAGLTLPLSGCVSSIEKVADSFGGSGRIIGETAVFKGVEVTPTEYVLAPAVKQSYANAQGSQQAASGATFLLTHLEVHHKGDSAQEFPKTRFQDNVDLYYNGEQVHEGPRAEISDSYIVEGKRLTSYHKAIADADARGEVYPGTNVEGWLFHEVATNFSPGNLELQITWNQQMIGDEGETRHIWTYTSDAETPISELEGNGDDTISMQVTKPNRT